MAGDRARRCESVPWQVPGPRCWGIRIPPLAAGGTPAARARHRPTQQTAAPDSLLNGEFLWRTAAVRDGEGAVDAEVAQVRQDWDAESGTRGANQDRSEFLSRAWRCLWVGEVRGPAGCLPGRKSSLGFAAHSGLPAAMSRWADVHQGVGRARWGGSGSVRWTVGGLAEGVAHGEEGLRTARDYARRATLGASGNWRSP